MIETTIVIAIVATAAFLIGRSLYRGVSGKRSGTGCGCGDSCPASDKCDSRPIELKTK
jgi:hypothetical protein